MATPQQYCLRWNNHRSNLLNVFDQLLQNEAFTDVTLACEGGTSVKCHKMVLAACSSYFQGLFTDLPCRHPVVILKDVKYSEIKAILEYMYRGEVNVGQDQLAPLLKVAEALKVKGLVEENGAKPPVEEDPNMITTSSPTAPPPMPHSSSVNDSSPPHSTGIHNQGFPKYPYLYGKSPAVERGGGGGRISLPPMWGMPGMPIPAPPPTHHLNSCYEAAMAGTDLPPLRRKKLSSLLMNRGDTPILRTVLGQGQADSSQPMPLVCHPDSHERNTNGSPRDSDKSMKTEPSEDAPSPYTDISFMEDDPERANKMPYSSPQSGYGESKGVGGVSSALVTYVPTQKPEWKRYKQYTRNDIMSAIEAVRSGMSALQAARKYGVPSRTLYDKVKKLGITTGRPFRRSSIGNGGPGFPYGLGSSGMMFGGGEEENSTGNNGSNYGNMEHSFLHHALEPKYERPNEPDREATATMNTQSNVSNHSSSPGNNGRSPSPTLIRYAHRNSMTPSPPPPPAPPAEQDEDRVEDLSMGRKPEPPSRVIMPPMSQATATAMLTTGSDSHSDARD
ncbi:uncharacterized protein LOC128986087 [Macrosteles quadrilineatus]|uniref:uncharacterized protein LOC128986087 n=1 Tax=Macrosteles quadrilineatus TaxID=74068 RepID=UPI0023E0AFD3|nr:uncharacterized protein LOC128986087 [Macrosteles quadrilineatus]